MNELLFNTNKIGKYDKYEFLRLSTAGPYLNYNHNNKTDETIASQRDFANNRPYEQIFQKIPIETSRPIINTDDDNITSILLNKTKYGYKDVSGLKITEIPKSKIIQSKYQPISGLVM